MALRYDKEYKTITVAAPQTELDVADLYDDTKDWDELAHNMEVLSPAAASGGESLGAGESVGQTIKLINWKLKFEDRPGPETILCFVGGGNLIAVFTYDTYIPAGWAPDGAQVNFDTTLPYTEVEPWSIEITALSGSTQMVVTDDGAGNLIGDVGSGVNTVDYSTGAMSVTFVSPPDNGVNISVTYSFDEQYVNPIEPATFVTVTFARSSSTTIAGLDITNIQRLIETLRPHHTGTGNIWYWDPYLGNDSNDGTRWDKAFKTFAKAHETAVDYNHDIIYCYPGNPAGITVTEEQIVITKHSLFIRGPGRDFRFIPTDMTKPTITVAPGARGIELSGLLVRTAAAGGQSAIRVNGAGFVLIEDVWVENASGHGIEFINGAYNGIVNRTHVMYCSSDGIYIGNNVSDLQICHNNCIVGCGGHGINYAGSSIARGGVGTINLSDNAGYGVNIGSGALKVCLAVPDFLCVNNTLGDINDQGTDTGYASEIFRERIRDRIHADRADYKANVTGLARTTDIAGLARTVDVTQSEADVRGPDGDDLKGISDQIDDIEVDITPVEPVYYTQQQASYTAATQITRIYVGHRTMTADEHVGKYVKFRVSKHKYRIVDNSDHWFEVAGNSTVEADAIFDVVTS